MGELALRKKGGNNRSFYQLETTNVSMSAFNLPMFDYNNVYKIGELTPSKKTGRFVVSRNKNYHYGGGTINYSDEHYSDAMALFSIYGYNSGLNTIDAGDYTGKQTRSCIPSTAGVLFGSDAVCTLKVPVVFWFTDGGRMESDSEVYAEGDMTFDVYFDTDSEGAKVLVFDWSFDGTVKENMYDRSGNKVSVPNPSLCVSVDIVEGE